MLKKNKLSKNESEVIIRARDHYLDAMRIYSANPPCFDSTIACLKEIAQACHLCMAVCVPHEAEKEKAERESRTSHFSFFKARNREKMLKEMLIIEEAKKKMLDGFVETAMHAAFAKEPRIIGLNYHDDQYTRENKKGEIISQTDVEEYTITFSDHSTLILHDLMPTFLDQARVKFFEKMEALAGANADKTVSLA